MVDLEENGVTFRRYWLRIPAAYFAVLLLPL